MKVLGIETSCDETAAAIVDDKGHILANILLSQLEEHRVYGGVVPEIAARTHLEHLDRLIAIAMEKAGIGFKELDGVAATCGPGLIGGVMVGMMAGKAIAAAHNLPFVGVNHLEAHALTPRLTDGVTFPYLLLLISGGHTQILAVEDVGTYKLWGTTLDDALGECFDKSARIMGLPHPFAQNLEKIATECADKKAALARFPLPRPMKGRKELDFSFSGLKTAVRQHVEALPAGDLKRADIAALACSFQDAVADCLNDRCRRAIERFMETYPPQDNDTRDSRKPPALVISGGVAANKTVRAALENLATQHKMAFSAPPIGLCSDNGAMIAWTGIERLQRGLTDPLDIAARPRWPLDPNRVRGKDASVKGANRRAAT